MQHPILQFTYHTMKLFADGTLVGYDENGNEMHRIKLLEILQTK